MSELRFISEDEAIQYLADISGKRVKIAARFGFNFDQLKNTFDEFKDTINSIKRKARSYKSSVTADQIEVIQRALDDLKVIDSQLSEDANQGAIK